MRKLKYKGKFGGFNLVQSTRKRWYYTIYDPPNIESFNLKRITVNQLYHRLNECIITSELIKEIKTEAMLNDI